MEYFVKLIEFVGNCEVYKENRNIIFIEEITADLKCLITMPFHYPEWLGNYVFLFLFVTFTFRQKQKDNGTFHLTKADFNIDRL